MSPNCEITWSLMHPTTIDSSYMSRVINEAKNYDVDSFEICGAFANEAGGLNGLLLFEPYSNAKALCNVNKVLETQSTLTNIVEQADSIGKKVYLWHREIMMPKGMLLDCPRMLDKNGEFDLLSEDFLNFLRYKIDNAFKVVPKLGGIVLTLTEADYSVIHNSDPKKYPPDKVVETIVRLFAQEHQKFNKRFILRSFGSIAEDYEDILRGARKVAQDYLFDIETKITPYDFDPFLPLNPFLVKQDGTLLNAECDCLGEFLGAGYLPAANVEMIAHYVNEGRKAQVSRYAIRIDRIGNNVFDSHEINLFAYHSFIRNPNITPDKVYQMWAQKHWPNCQKEMINLAKMGLAAVLKTNFICGNVIFHKFPILPDWKWVAAGGILGVFKDNVSLKQLRGEWGILSNNMSPSRNTIRKEKQEALQLAQNGFNLLKTLEDRLSVKEYEKAYRVWHILNIACQAIGCFVESIAAYFDDLEDNSSEPVKLKIAIEKAVSTIDELLVDKSDTLPTMESCCDGAAVPKDNLDRVYLKGLRLITRQLLEQYLAEVKLRKQLTNDKTTDIVLTGSFSDQYRIYRYMHASHTNLVDNIPVRYAGNTVFPNGFFEVELKTQINGKIIIYLLPQSAKEVKLSLDGIVDNYPVPLDGKIVLTSRKELSVLRVEKVGVDYPAVYAIVGQSN